MGLVWLLRGRRVIQLTASDAVLEDGLRFRRTSVRQSSAPGGPAKGYCRKDPLGQGELLDGSVDVRSRD